MEIIDKIISLKENFPRTAMALGTFDGIHVGHQKIISRAVDLAKQINGTSIVFTFSNHPLSVVAPDRCPPQLVTQSYKAELIQELGVDVLLSIPFTPDFLQLSASQFINLIVKNINPKHIVVGPNFFFGYNRGGTPEFLQSSGLKYGFNVEVPQIVYVNDTIASSTLIRQLVMEGHVDKASHLLGRLVTMQGTVIHGDKRGRELGYPTINLEFPDELVLPPDGVYAVYVTIEGIRYKGIANIGNNPTFNGIDRRLEAHILNYSGDLYGQFVSVSFLKRIRGQITFSSPEKLKLQIGQDIEAVQLIF